MNHAGASQSEQSAIDMYVPSQVQGVEALPVHHQLPLVQPLNLPRRPETKSPEAVHGMRQEKSQALSAVFGDPSTQEELETYSKQASICVAGQLCPYFLCDDQKNNDTDVQYNTYSTNSPVSSESTLSSWRSSVEFRLCEKAEGAMPSTIDANDVTSSDSAFSTDCTSPSSSISKTAKFQPKRKSCGITKIKSQKLEDLLLSTSNVSNVCLVSPKAGPFEGQFVALIATTVGLHSNNDEILLIPDSDSENGRKQIQTLKTVVAEWGADAQRPDVWILLQSLPVGTDGKPDPRSLQTWVQNMGEADEVKVMRMQLFNHRRTGPRQLAPSRSLRPDSMAQPDLGARSLSRSPLPSEKPRVDFSQKDCFPLAPMQQILFRTSTSPSVASRDYRFSQGVLLKVKSVIELADLEAAISVLVTRHPMLRVRFVLTEEGWAQVIAPQSKRAYRFEHQYIYNDDDLLTVIKQTRQSLDLLMGPMFAATHIRNASNEQMIYLVAHKVAVDPVSFHLLINDLDELLCEGVLLSEPGTPFTHWAAHQSCQNSQQTITPCLPFEVDTAHQEYWGLTGQSNLYGEAARLTFSLPTEATFALRTTVNNVLRTESADILLAALLHSFQQTFPDRHPPTVWKLEHDRNARDTDLDIAKTIGCFTSLVPLSTSAHQLFDLIQLIKMVKDTRKIAPQSDVLLSEFADKTTEAASLPVEITFNCTEPVPRLKREIGVLEPAVATDGESRPATFDAGHAVGRIGLFEVSVNINDFDVSVELCFNANVKNSDRPSRWMQNFEKSILEAISLLSSMEPELTLSDVPLLDTSYDRLSMLTGRRLVDVGISSVENIETIRPIDPHRQEMLIAQGQDPTCFHVSQVYELATHDGSLIDQADLCAAWETLVSAHGALRSIFIKSVSEKSLFDQVVLKKITPNMLFIDSSDPMETLSSIPPMKALRAKPGHRLSVSRSQQKTFLRIDCSQTLCDLAALHLLVTQLRQLFAGHQVAIIAEPLPLRRHRHITSLESSHGIEIWKSWLSGGTSCIFPHLDLQTLDRFESRGIKIDLSRDRILQFCAKSQLDMSTVIQMAWALVLRTYVGQDRVTFGYQIPETASQYIESLARFVPCMVNFSPMTTIFGLLRQLQQEFKQAASIDIPTLSEIEHSLGIRGKGLFNTCVICQDVPDTIRESGDAETTTWEPQLLETLVDGNCDLSLCVTVRNDQTQVDVSYAGFSPLQLKNIMNTFQQALQTIINAPEQPLCQVDLFTEHDSQQIMNPDWEPDQIDIKISTCLHNLILRQCQARPHAPAVYAWDGELSYHAVASNVSKLASYLVNRGVGPGVLVPVVLEKSLWSPVIMLAVMQAGGCFVCLDAHDVAMTVEMIHQLEPQLVVVTEGASKHVGQFSRNSVLVNGAFLNSLPSQITILSHEVQPQQAACAFLTPGVRHPKGFFYTHESLCSIFSVQGPALKINERSRVLQISAYTMDIALVECLVTLLHGGCVCIPSAPERVNDLEGTLARMDITWTYMTTVLSRKINPEAVPNLQTICFRTRTLDEDTYTPWLGRTEVLVAYGAPNICPLALSAFNISRAGDTDVVAPPLVGRFLILNPEDPKKLVPLGAVGELAIDSPIITPHKYVHGRTLIDPSTLDVPKGPRKWRYLRTGHRVRYIDRGHVLFLSAMRDVGLLNGSPTMTSILERQIRLCLGGDVDVVVEQITTNDTITSLAAFLEFGDSEFVGPSELDKLSTQMRSKLAAVKWLTETFMIQSTKLDNSSPSHHIPSLFIPVRRFPLSSSLKVNRRKLQKMTSQFSFTQLFELANVSFSSKPYFTGIQSKPLPLTQTEESMRLMWAAVMHAMIADIKPADSFFDAGGDKLLAMRLVLCCRQNGVDISINDVLGGATLTELCRSIDLDEQNILPRRPSKARRPTKSNAAVRKFAEGTVRGCDNLNILPQLGLPWSDVIDIAEASSRQIQCLESSLFGPRSDIRCLVMHFNGRLQQKRVRDACEALTQLHPMLRTGFAFHERKVFQVAIDSFHADFSFNSVLAEHIDAESKQVINRYEMEKLELRQPATKFSFLDGGQQGKLIVRLSYAQISESAVPRLVQDFVKLYENPEKDLRRTSFFDYVRALKGPRSDDSIHYWKQRLEKSKITQVVPHSRPLPPVTDVKSIQEVVQVSKMTEFGVTFDSVVKAAWAMTMATVSGSPDVVFGEIVEGRRLKLETSVDVSSIAGPMENIVAVRVRLPIVNSSPLQLLQLIQRDSAASLPYEAIGAQKIVQECTDWANWSQFSTIVRHRKQVPVDGITTLNIDNTTFTYNLVQPSARDMPDLFVSSTMVSQDKFCLSIEYSPSRVPEAFVEAAMGLLVASVSTLGCYETISQPILQPSSDYETIQPRILLEKPQPDVVNNSYVKWLSASQRNSLEQFLLSIWRETLHPAVQPPGESELLEARFYDISGSILQAHFVAERLNTELRQRVDIEGIHVVCLNAVDLIHAPTISAQIDLITHMMHQAGVLQKPGRKRPAVSFHAGMPSESAAIRNRDWATMILGEKGKANLRRLRHGRNHSHGNIKDSGKRAGEIGKSRVNVKKEQSPIIVEDFIRESPSREVIASDNSAGRERRAMDTVPEAAVEIGPGAVVAHHHGDVSPLSRQSSRENFRDELHETMRSISPRSWIGELDW